MCYYFLYLGLRGEICIYYFFLFIIFRKVFIKIKKVKTIKFTTLTKFNMRFWKNDQFLLMRFDDLNSGTVAGTGVDWEADGVAFGRPLF